MFWKNILSVWRGLDSHYNLAWITLNHLDFLANGQNKQYSVCYGITETCMKGGNPVN